MRMLQQPGYLKPLGITSGGATSWPMSCIISLQEGTMIFTLAILFGVAWLLGISVFHVTAAAIHLLLVLAVACVIAQLVRGVRKPVDRLRR